MTERTRQQLDEPASDVVPHLPAPLVDLPPPGTATRQRLLESIEALRVATTSEEAAQSGELQSLLDAIALRGSDQDLHTLLNLLDQGSLEHLDLHGGPTAEVYAVEALLASGNPLALGMRPEVFERYQAACAETGWAPVRTHVGIVLVLLSLLVALSGAIAYFAQSVAEGPFNAFLTTGGLSLAYGAAALPTLWQALRRSRKARAGFPWAAMLIGGLAPMLIAFSLWSRPDLLLPLALGAGIAAGNALLIPKKRASSNLLKSRRNRPRS